jgi:hypothetical protein
MADAPDHEPGASAVGNTLRMVRHGLSIAQIGEGDGDVRTGASVRTAMLVVTNRADARPR